MSTTAVVSIIIASICLLWATYRIGRSFFNSTKSDTITLVKGKKQITIHKIPTEEDRQKLAHF